MNNQRKILYLSVVINFAVGIILGIVLFFAQLRSGEGVSQNLYEYDTNVSLTDFFRLVWASSLWLLSIVTAHGMLRSKTIHPVIIIRGCVNAFSVLYIVYLFGILEAAVAFIPQCFSVLPLLLIFSAETAHRRSDKEQPEKGIIFKRSDILAILALSILSSAAEIFLFKAFCTYLF